MKNFFKTLSIIFFAFCIVLFSGIVYESTDIPDEINVTDIENADLGKFLNISSENAVMVSNNGFKEIKATVNALRVFPVKNITVNIKGRRYVGVGGDIFGIKLYTKGAIVINVDTVASTTGTKSPAAQAGLKCGDIITHVGSEAIESAVQLNNKIEGCNGECLNLTVERNGEMMKLKLTPVLSVNGSYKAGLWVRDSSAGIGTITFYDDVNKVFVGLGHAVCDVDTGKIMPLANGEAVKATVNGYYKSVSGNPGELCGVFTDVTLGNIKFNHETGIYVAANKASESKLMPVALESEIKTGPAQMIATIDETGPHYYDIEITKIFPAADYTVRNMVIKVTDEELLEKTGGIVQGMSGSPIVQNSMLVGAVTHVFVNSPDQGYAIMASRMIENLDADFVLEEKAAS